MELIFGFFLISFSDSGRGALFRMFSKKRPFLNLEIFHKFFGSSDGYKQTMSCSRKWRLIIIQIPSRAQLCAGHLQSIFTVKSYPIPTDFNYESFPNASFPCTPVCISHVHACFHHSQISRKPTSHSRKSVWRVVKLRLFWSIINRLKCEK